MIIYLSVINLIGLLAMGIDKFKAKKKLWRIPEGTLFLLSLIGGSLGAWIGMYMFHHKTNKLKFIVGIPAIFVLQIIIFLFIKKF